LDRLWGPRGIAVASDGRIYVTDAGNKRVVVYSSEGTALFEFATGGDGQLDEPVGIAVGPEGNIYVADTWNLRVVVFSPEGEYISSFNVQGWGSNSVDNKPYLSVGPDNRIYLTDPRDIGRSCSQVRANLWLRLASTDPKRDPLVYRMDWL
jgi:DNA-binding beta-propeller fold protein YncE